MNQKLKLDEDDHYIIIMALKCLQDNLNDVIYGGMCKKVGHEQVKEAFDLKSKLQAVVEKLGIEKFIEE